MQSESIERADRQAIDEDWSNKVMNEPARKRQTACIQTLSDEWWLKNRVL